MRGLQELEPDWHETVLEIITRPPVSDILKISAYSPQPADMIPITWIERPPVSLVA